METASQTNRTSIADYSPLELAEKVPHAFMLDLKHARLSLLDMFRVSRMFDFHEVPNNGYSSGDSVRNLIVDVIEVTPERTTLHVKPSRPLSYDAMASEVDAMVTEIGARVFSSQIEVSRLAWIIKPMGMPSHGRAAFGVVA